MLRLLALAATLALPAPATAQHFRNRVDFTDLLRGHVEEAIGLAHLPVASKGAPLDDPAVVVTATATGVNVSGQVALPLTAGHADASAVRRCRGEVVCAPALRDAIADARARLTAGLESDPDTAPPPVLLLATRELPYPTLLLTARSAAEAGAALSLAVVARGPGDTLVGIPVLVGPGREITLGRAQSPSLIGIAVDRRRLVVRATAATMSRPVTAADPDDLDITLGRLALSSGRTACFVTATATSTAGEVMDAAAVALRSFPHLVLTDPAGVRVVAD